MELVPSENGPRFPTIGDIVLVGGMGHWGQKYKDHKRPGRLGSDDTFFKKNSIFIVLSSKTLDSDFRLNFYYELVILSDMKLYRMGISRADEHFRVLSSLK